MADLPAQLDWRRILPETAPPEPPDAELFLLAVAVELDRCWPEPADALRDRVRTHADLVVRLREHLLGQQAQLCGVGGRVGSCAGSASALSACAYYELLVEEDGQCPRPAPSSTSAPAVYHSGCSSSYHGLPECLPLPPAILMSVHLYICMSV